MTDAAIHRVSGDANGNGGWLPCSFHSSLFHLHSSIYWFTVDRHGLSALAMTNNEMIYVLSRGGDSFTYLCLLQTRKIFFGRPINPRSQ